MGEVIVMSITNTTKELPEEGTNEDSRLPMLTSFENDSSENNFVHKNVRWRTRPAAISMQLKEKVSLELDDSLLSRDIMDT